MAIGCLGAWREAAETVFLVEVAYRDAATLLPIIANHVKQSMGTTSYRTSVSTSLSITQQLVV